ncbi:hypothetical protein PAV_109p00500 (plasmid) [Paenibacillus alvei DSM 29]|uniref:hypothetical protein n=1 Tax=Paenibacillus alvei TaxID=44250 RepID=UPI000288E44D|nr:hypothetical protein [Paenibacillus alvei]EJW13820.1 hypothetical protein PAV_109p00500 [Paenibacillus alvei DSM 29]
MSISFLGIFLNIFPKGEVSMLTNAIYSSLVGTHFSSTEFKVTCALIDQRIANNLPSLELRKNLLHSLQQEKRVGSTWMLSN